jgi:hypothetical protein
MRRTASVCILSHGTGRESWRVEVCGRSQQGRGAQMRCSHCGRPLVLVRPPTPYPEVRSEPIRICTHCTLTGSD